LISEEQPGYLDSTRIDSSLALGKLTAEYLISYYSEKFGYKFSIARCFSFAGQYLPLNLHYAFGNFANCALHGENITVSSDGTDKRSYMYIGDAIAWLLNMIESPKNQTLNVGSEKSISILDLARIFANSVGTRVQTLNRKHEVGNFRRINYTPSTQKARTIYPHLQEWTCVDEIVSKTLRVS
jgi:dTDP-glucose 4,6-dehydratase/UDP-glucose 4-epimerase